MASYGRRPRAFDEANALTTASSLAAAPPSNLVEAGRRRVRAPLALLLGLTSITVKGAAERDGLFRNRLDG